jgi:hypothetical protein
MKKESQREWRKGSSLDLATLVMIEKITPQGVKDLVTAVKERRVLNEPQPPERTLRALLSDYISGALIVLPKGSRN